MVAYKEYLKKIINRQLSYVSVTEFVKELGLIVTAWHR